ncbi:NAD(P) transhydrogenase [Sclerotinia borealis F-4128]|uniref:proton-translocating NAD(P)(+) transhydrogenase n=1 Tax=Sclerotinia borealis (strain F-4128) TaxID=1432307 RepID=W9C8M0_SCLBF|nr:NAD(P) transhydrogenase [Sclerotinia borealis F-4128]
MGSSPSREYVPAAPNTASLSTGSSNAVVPDLITTLYSNLILGISPFDTKEFSRVLVERSAGAEARFTDEPYDETAGAKISVLGFQTLHGGPSHCHWAGVAGFIAIATVNSTHGSNVREQVQSLDFKEDDGSGAGGYGKEMSKEFIEGEKKLFMERCREVDIVICTARIPGRPALVDVDTELIWWVQEWNVFLNLICVRSMMESRMLDEMGIEVWCK